ncbi:hypothetical protein BJX68DRAFT_256720 [Aspergillus pseudodeflectus]|uniref:NACHT domain-containing protein n=1 Tax=Aspergillus pseudodeflectus TaxID=176178 RepID=A0ABR4JZX5_9EURO
MLQPLVAMDQSQSSTSLVVVIDALDECEREEDVVVILKLLLKPSAARIDSLAIMAVPLFIFAATDSPGSKIDKTYQLILNQLLADNESNTDQLVEEFQKTISVIILLTTPLLLSALTELLEILEDDISTRLDAFHLVLTIPDDHNLPIRTLHLSFHDYLCLTIIRCLLRKNIYNLPTYRTRRSEIDSTSIVRFILHVL